LDGPVAPRLSGIARRANCRPLAKVIDNGVLAQNAMVRCLQQRPQLDIHRQLGAWPGTHGITDTTCTFPEIRWTGPRCFYSGDVKAEYLWNAIARAGKSPSSSIMSPRGPLSSKRIQIVGTGCVYQSVVLPGSSCLAARQPRPHRRRQTTAGVRLDEDGLGWGKQGRQYTPRSPCASAHAPFSPSSRCTNQDRTEKPSGWSNLPPATSALEAD